MLKKVIVVKGKANIGKTTTIKMVFELLSKKFPHLKTIYSVISKWDITVIIEINGIKIGIESQGDICEKGKRMDNSFKLFVEKECQIILCASRTRGSTKQCVKELKNIHGYDIDWNKKPISTITSEEKKDNQEMANEIFKKIVAMI